MNATPRLVDDPLFATFLIHSDARTTIRPAAPFPRIAAVVDRRLVVNGRDERVELTAGQFCLIPVSLGDAALTFEKGSVAAFTSAAPSAGRVADRYFDAGGSGRSYCTGHPG